MCARLSIIIPVHNEAENVRRLHAELHTVLSTLGLQAEMIFIDDGSNDETWSKVVQILGLDARAHAARFRSRRGKAAALAAGFRLASGDYIVTLDGDLQDDPQEIPRLLQLAMEGYDVVCGWKQDRCDPCFKIWGSRMFNWLIGSIWGLRLHDHNCGLKCLRAEVVQEIRLFGELHRFITILAHCKGFRVTEVPVRHRPRRHGRSKYGPLKPVEGLLDLLVVRALTVFLEKPFHLLGTAGLAISALGLAGLGYLAVYWLMGLGSIGNRPLLIYSAAALLSGLHLIALGITAELINWRLSETRAGSIRKLSGKDFKAAAPLTEEADELQPLMHADQR
jgi:glycosyltransferase involved in cell wall biosynthesis